MDLIFLGEAAVICDVAVILSKLAGRRVLGIVGECFVPSSQDVLQVDRNGSPPGLPSLVEAGSL